MNKIVKMFFSIIANLLAFMVLTFIFCASFLLFYWATQLADYNFLSFADGFCKQVYLIQSHFYDFSLNPSGTDFTFLVASLNSLILAMIVKYLLDYLKKVEKSYDFVSFKMKQNSENSFNKRLEREYINKEKKIKKFIFFIQIEIDKIFTNKLGLASKSENIEDMLFLIKKEFSSKILSEFNVSSIKANEKLVFLFNNFDEADELFKYVYKFFSDKKTELYTKKINLNYIASVDVLGENQNVDKVLNLLQQINDIMSKNKILCLNTFKHRYQIQSKQLFTFNCYGSVEFDVDRDESMDVFFIKFKD